MKFNSLIVRSAVTVAVAASCGYVSASTLATTGGSQKVSAQRVLEAADAIGATTITVDQVRSTLGAQYSTNGRVTLTLTNGTFNATPTSATCYSAADPSMTLVRESGGASGNTSVVYLVTGISAGQNTIDDVCTFHGVALNTSSLSGNTKIEFTATNNQNAAIDSVTGSAILASVSDQFALVSDVDFDGIIDVQSDLLRFTSNSITATPEVENLVGGGVYAADVYSFKVSAYSVSASNTAAPQTFEAVIAGDFSFVKDADAVCSAGSLTAGAGRIGITATSSTAASVALTGTTCDSLTVKLSPTGVATLANAAGRELDTSLMAYKAFSGTGTAASVAFNPVTSFAASGVRFGYGAVASARSQTVASYSAGSWSTNGTTIDVPYMPFGTSSPAISHVITLNNRSGSAGTIRVSAWRAAGTYGNVAQTAVACPTQSFSLGTVGAQTVKNISGDVLSYVQNTCGWGTGQTRVALRFDVATPAASTELYSSFTLDGTRSNVVVNSSNGRGSSTR